MGVAMKLFIMPVAECVCEGFHCGQWLILWRRCYAFPACEKPSRLEAVDGMDSDNQQSLLKPLGIWGSLTTKPRARPYKVYKKG